MDRARFTRRQWLAGAGLAAFGSRRQPAWAAQEDAAGRIARVIRAYDEQGYHRTATGVDQLSAKWLAAEVARIGLTPSIESFTLTRVDPLVASIQGPGRRITGIPLFDGAFTTPGGVTGRLGALNSNAEIGLTETAVNAAAAGALGEARRANRHLAIVAITRGRRSGLCPSNADAFLQPFGPPVLQVSTAEIRWLTYHASRGTRVKVTANVAKNQASAGNVIAELPGSHPALPPIVVMTPRSGWYRCASERGGGIACWLEVMRGLQRAPLKRPVLFVASSGHEIGHLGIDAYIEKRPGIVTRAAAWLHLGANIGAATDLNNNLIQASDDEMEGALSEAMTSAGLTIARRARRGNVPAGEAEAVHTGGGHYVSAIGGNALFHHVDDRGPFASDPPTIEKFSAAMIALARRLDARS